MVKNNFFIITGGPGGGKTSLLENLVSKGFNYISETARQIIKERLFNVMSPRPEPNIFAKEMFVKDFTNYISNSLSSSILFFDRSFIDSAYLLFRSDTSAYNDIKDILLTNRYNDKVFITPPWEDIYCNDSERDQTFEESIVVYEELYKWYEVNGYCLIIIPKDSIEKRANFILKEVLG